MEIKTAAKPATANSIKTVNASPSSSKSRARRWRSKIKRLRIEPARKPRPSQRIAPGHHTMDKFSKCRPVLELWLRLMRRKRKWAMGLTVVQQDISRSQAWNSKTTSGTRARNTRSSKVSPPSSSKVSRKTFLIMRISGRWISRWRMAGGACRVSVRRMRCSTRPRTRRPARAKCNSSMSWISLSSRAQWPKMQKIQFKELPESTFCQANSRYPPSKMTKNRQ